MKKAGIREKFSLLEGGGAEDEEHCQAGINRSTVSDGYVKSEGNEIHESISLVTGLIMILKQSAPIIVGMIFHPFYMMINAVYLGRLEVDPNCTDSSFKEENPNYCISSKIF